MSDPVRLYGVHQAPLSMGFPRQECWSELPFPSPGDLPELGSKLTSPAWQAGSLPLNHLESSPYNSAFTGLFFFFLLIIISFGVYLMRLL